MLIPLLKTPARRLLDRLLHHPRLSDRMRQLAEEVLDSKADHLARQVEAAVTAALRQRLHVPNLAISPHVEHGAFMRHSTCSTSDFLHPRFHEICALLRHRPIFHRKLWEWVYIVHKLMEAGVLAPGQRGLGFGVGRERLPAVFASLGAQVVATDAPAEVGAAMGWAQSLQHSQSAEQLRHPEIVADTVFDASVSYRACDMRAIDPGLTGFDFTWSSCCFEHLGSLEAGMQFVIDSVEQTLRSGGVACHTTEFNLSSDEETVAHGGTVLYRRRDMLELVDRLRARGHEVQPFAIAPDCHFLDGHVDVPPYTEDPHLRLRMGQYVATSVGIVVRRA